MHTMTVLVAWREILLPATSWEEKLLRPLVVYVALLIAFRLVARRGQAQATLFDFLIILLISNVVQNAMIGEDNSVLGALAGAAVLLVLSAILDRTVGWSDGARRLLEGRAAILVADGRLDEEAFHRLDVDVYDLHAAVRKSGLSRLADVGFAVLELDGTISIIRREEAHAPHDCLPGDIAPFAVRRRRGAG